MIEKACKSCQPQLYWYPVDQMDCDVCGTKLPDTKTVLGLVGDVGPRVQTHMALNAHLDTLLGALGMVPVEPRAQSVGSPEVGARWIFCETCDKAHWSTERCET